MKIIHRTIAIRTKLSQLAQEFGYKLEADAYEDVHHGGYHRAQLRKDNLNLPEGYEDLNKILPWPVAEALESAEREAYAVAIVKAREEAFKEALEAIDVGQASYQDENGNSIAAPAGIQSVEIDSEKDEVELTILNPEHLLNAIFSGVGRFAPELSATEPASNQEIEARLHHLKDFFEVYGVRKPSGDLSSQFVPDINQDFLKEELAFRLGEMTIDQVVEAIREVVEAGEMSPSEAVAKAKKFVEFSAKEIKAAVLQDVRDQQNFWEKDLA